MHFLSKCLFLNFLKPFYRFLSTSFKVDWEYQPIADISDIAYNIWITSLIPGLSIYLHFQKTSFCMIYERFSLMGTKNCPHKVKNYRYYYSSGVVNNIVNTRHAHTHAHTHKPTADFTVSNSPTLHVFWLCGKSDKAHTNTGITPQQKELLAQLGPFCCEANLTILYICRKIVFS